MLFRSIIEKIAQVIAKENSITSNTEKVTVVVDNKKYTMSVGDILEVKYNGEVRRVRILGFKHDDLVDQTVYGGTHGKASISFEFLDFITGSTYMTMNSTNTNEDGWIATQIRKDLNGYTTNNATQNEAIGGLGSNLNMKGHIKQVKKSYIRTYDDANSVAICNDYLWLLAASEVVPQNNDSTRHAYAITAEGNQYKYYKGITEAWNISNLGRTKYNGSGNANNWWLRSPCYSNSTYFCSVNYDGNTDYTGNASHTRGIAPGFSI